MHCAFTKVASLHIGYYACLYPVIAIVMRSVSTEKRVKPVTELAKYAV